MTNRDKAPGPGTPDPPSSSQMPDEEDGYRSADDGGGGDRDVPEDVRPFHTAGLCKNVPQSGPLAPNRVLLYRSLLETAKTISY